MRISSICTYDNKPQALAEISSRNNNAKKTAIPVSFNAKTKEVGVLKGLGLFVAAIWKDIFTGEGTKMSDEDRNSFDYDDAMSDHPGI